MTYRLNIKTESDYLLVKLKGAPEFTEVLNFWGKVRDEAVKANLRKILIDAPLDEKLQSFSTAQNYSISSKLVDLGFEPGTMVAVLYHSERFFQTDQFGETVARNRGFNVRVFNDHDSAVNWLTS